MVNNYKDKNGSLELIEFRSFEILMLTRKMISCPQTIKHSFKKIIIRRQILHIRTFYNLGGGGPVWSAVYRCENRGLQTLL